MVRRDVTETAPNSKPSLPQDAPASLTKTYMISGFVCRHGGLLHDDDDSSDKGNDNNTDYY